jgi:hypothetical protein
VRQLQSGARPAVAPRAPQSCPSGVTGGGGGHDSSSGTHATEQRDTTRISEHTCNTTGERQEKGKLKLHKHLRVGVTCHLNELVTAPDLMRRKLDEFALFARRQKREEDRERSLQKEARVSVRRVWLAQLQKQVCVCVCVRGACVQGGRGVWGGGG